MRSFEIWCDNFSFLLQTFVKSYVVFYLALLKFEMAEKFGIFEAINHILLLNESESDFKDGDEEEAELLQLPENDLGQDYDLNLDMNIFAFSTKTIKSIR